MNPSSPGTYFNLSKQQHQHLQVVGKQLFETIQDTRKSRQDVPSTLLTVVRNPSDVPDVTPVQKKIYRLEQQVLALEKEIAKTIVDLAKKESYDLIVYQGVIFASDKVDITEKVLNNLKSR